MKRNILFARMLFVLSLMFAVSCNDHLDEINVNPNGIDPATSNPTLLLPTVMTSTALSYLDLGYGNIAGVVQHTQKDGWYTGHNHYDWGPTDWIPWFNILRNNDLLQKRSAEMNYPTLEGIAFTMRAFVFGVITDLWGDAPYTFALKGNQSTEFLQPPYDNQEVIYKGIIEDLKAASALFARKDASGMVNNYDVFYNGNIDNWQKFAHTLMLRYYMRVSAKLPEYAKAGIESVYSTGIYIKVPAEDAVMNMLGQTAANSWPAAVAFDGEQSNFRRIKPAKPLIDLLKQHQDPRLPAWFATVHVQWVADPNLPVAVDPFIRRNGVVMEGVAFQKDLWFLAQRAAGNKFTRHFNPNLIPSSLIIETDEYVGVPSGSLQPDYYNNNPTPGQEIENQHVSQLANVFRQSSGPLLKARLASSSETSFILAEAARKGYNVGSAQTHYNNGVKNSLDTWGVGAQYDAYIARPGVAFNNTDQQILTQKWIAGWTTAMEAWFDFRRTGFPALTAGPASPQPVLPVRFIYGNNELNFNSTSIDAALQSIQETPYSVSRGKNSQWSKPWIIQGTGKPW
jgi:hypothetical protein